MPRKIEARQDTILPYSYHIAMGISTDSRELSEEKQHSFERFLGTSEVTRNYSSVIKHDATPKADNKITNKAFNDTLIKVYDLLAWQDNWNGYNAPAPKLDAIVYALTWLNAFYHLVTGASWQNPNVTAGSEGEVVFE